MDSGRPAGARAAVPRGAAAQWNDLVSRREAEPVRLPRGRGLGVGRACQAGEVREAREVREVDSGRPAGAGRRSRAGAAAQWEAEPTREPRAPDLRHPAAASGARPADSQNAPTPNPKTAARGQTTSARSTGRPEWTAAAGSHAEYIRNHSAKPVFNSPL